MVHSINHGPTSSKNTLSLCEKLGTLPEKRLGKLPSDSAVKILVAATPGSGSPRTFVADPDDNVPNPHNNTGLGNPRIFLVRIVKRNRRKITTEQ